MATVTANAFPLHWPEGWPRSKVRRSAAYRVKLAKARDDLINELRLMGAESIVISTNAPPRADNTPIAGAPQQPQGDPGVAVYFYLKGARQVIACDQWDRLTDNLRACGLTIAALRMIERTGASDLLDRAFEGFKMLPAPSSEPRPWWEVLRCRQDASRVGVRRAFEREAMARHPDRGGSDQDMAELNQAYKEALAATGE